MSSDRVFLFFACSWLCICGLEIKAEKNWRYVSGFSCLQVITKKAYCWERLPIKLDISISCESNSWLWIISFGRIEGQSVEHCPTAINEKTWSNYICPLKLNSSQKDLVSIFIRKVWSNVGTDKRSDAPCRLQSKYT